MITDVYNQALVGGSLEQFSDKEIYDCANYYINDKKYIFTDSAAEILKNPTKYAVEWGILQEASKRKKPGEDNIYANIATEKFSVIVNKLPSGMQGLRFLNNIGEFDKVVKYLKQIPPNQGYNTSWFNRSQKKLKEELTQDVYRATRKLALRKLWEIPGFKNLPKDVREQLIDQRAYLTRLRYDLEFKDIQIGKNSTDKLDEYSRTLRSNITNAINY